MLDVDAIRAKFPALNEAYNGRPAIFFDNPGGTQVPRSVIDAMVDYLSRRNANTHGVFETSVRTDATIDRARQAAADLLGADPGEIVFGNNMTSLTFNLARSLTKEFGPRDEVVVTRLDHDADIMPWVRLAEDKKAKVNWVDIDMENCTLDMNHVESLINPNTKLVAVGYASNASGTINDVKRIVELARTNGAYSFVDAVQYAPHGLIDVKELGCDFLACSAYKFFGPHVGILYGKRGLLERLDAYQVRPAAKSVPGKWEQGTKNHEGLAGVAAAIDYIAEIGVAYGGVYPNATRREKLIGAWKQIHDYEHMLIDRMIDGLQLIPRVRIYGITDRTERSHRLATISIRKEGTTPLQLAEALAEQNIFVWDGNFYAQALSERLGVEDSGGLLRIGMVHYNTLEEVDRCLRVVESV